MRKTALALPTLLLLVGIPARAQVMTNPVQDYINKTTILNNILSNRRATDMSQSAQTKGRRRPALRRTRRRDRRRVRRPTPLWKASRSTPHGPGTRRNSRNACDAVRGFHD